MKSFSGFVPNDRRAWHRAELLQLLGDDESLLEQLQQAENNYLFFVAGVARSMESDRSIHDDIKALAEALEVIQSIYNPGGAAKALFEGEAFRLVGGAKLQDMRDLFQGVPGEGLVMAARAALDKHQLQGGRPTKPQTIERRRLVAILAEIAARAGIEVKRADRAGNQPPFAMLLTYVFDRVEIDYESAHFVDSAIREYLESRAE